MSDGSTNSMQTPAAPAGSRAGGWSNLWQVPTIVVSLVLIVGGLYFGRGGRAEHDFDGALNDVEALLIADEFDRAAEHLRGVIQPHLHEASDQHHARFAALVGDMIYLSQEARGGATQATRQSIIERYASARQLGLAFDHERLERWATTLIDLGRFDQAREFIESIDALTIDEKHAEAAALARNRVMRRLVEASLRQRDLPFEEVMAVLGEYRANARLRLADVVWAIARQAELRLAADLTRESVDQLLIDMRRIESRLEYERVNLGELYTLLAQGYYQLVEYRIAEQQATRALELLEGSNPVRGAALEVLGRIQLATTRVEAAYESFHLSVIDFDATPSHQPALLGRAESSAVLGRHEESRRDYEHLARELARRQPRREINADRIARSLTDRHDAALATGQLELALSYMNLVAPFFAGREMPEQALVRLASTNRQLAENLLASAAEVNASEVDPGTRRQASEHYRQAGEFFLRRARALRPMPTEDAAWASSLWNAADCFDLAGYYEQAIEGFQQYVLGRSETDPRQIEAMHRLARCHQAVTQFAQSVELFEEVIARHPRSLFAAKSHVPLAQGYMALGRRADAERHLRRVISGEMGFEPEAIEFADALLALGTLLHDTGDHLHAIEVLDRFVHAYPDEPRLTEAVYRLADSYRLEARRLRQEIEAGNLPLSREQELERLRVAHLREAGMFFERARERYERLGIQRLDRLRQDQLRHTYLYRGDCAFELGEYARSIELYDHAARRYAEHPASLVALIQIVNAYMLLNDPVRAATAHNRALLRLQQIPESALRDSDSLMSAEAWEAWLRSLPPGLAMATGASN